MSAPHLKAERGGQPVGQQILSAMARAAEEFVEDVTLDTAPLRRLAVAVGYSDCYRRRCGDGRYGTGRPVRLGPVRALRIDAS